MMKKKPWTVMIYLAADNNLANFGVDSLKQMKAAAGPSINIVAEFDAGPTVPTRRYFFDGSGDSTGSIDENRVNAFDPIDGGDPANLTAFIEWADTAYPAKSYFLIIWGHGAGVDDSFPRTPDRSALQRPDASFVHRHALLNLQALKDVSHEMTTFAGTAAPPPVKALAFVDHPQSYLTNIGLKDALKKACRTMGRKLDLVGMDACNMNMVEIGYEIRDSADFLVASQDAIPDASWPYDHLVKELVETPDMAPQDLATLASSTYVKAYQDYIGAPVALSVLNLSFADEARQLFHDLVKILATCSTNTHIRAVITNARRQVKSFQDGMAVDLIHFCQLLCQHSADQHLLNASHAFLAEFQEFIAANKPSAGELNCNGTSIYFPLEEVGDFYKTLDFSQITGWGKFLESFL